MQTIREVVEWLMSGTRAAALDEADIQQHSWVWMYQLSGVGFPSHAWSPANYSSGFCVMGSISPTGSCKI